MLSFACSIQQKCCKWLILGEGLIIEDQNGSSIENGSGHSDDIEEWLLASVDFGIYYVTTKLMI